MSVYNHRSIAVVVCCRGNKKGHINGKWSSKLKIYIPDCAELMICVKQRPNSSITAFSASALDFPFCSMKKVQNPHFSNPHSHVDPYHEGMAGLLQHTQTSCFSNILVDERKGKSARVNYKIDIFIASPIIT